MAFNKEELGKIYSGEGSEAEKLDAIMGLYNDDVNGLKMTNQNLKEEKTAIKAKYDELKTEADKSAEALEGLKKQPEAGTPDDLRKAHQTQIDDLNKQMVGAISERDKTIEELKAKVAEATQKEHAWKCREAFNVALSKHAIEPGSQQSIMDFILGANGTANFSECDLGTGPQLVNKTGRTIDGVVNDFFNTDFGKKFLRNGNSGGGALGSNSRSTPASENPFITKDITAQSRLYREDPVRFAQLKKEAETAGK